MQPAKQFMLEHFFGTRRTHAPLKLRIAVLPLSVWLAWTAPPSVRAQDNYEIQVYGSETVAPNATMVELHSNFTVEGSKTTENGVLPTDHAEHETLEITRGFTPWFETGFYVFSSIRSDQGWQWVGDHIRPRVRVPENWHWPVGLSLSTEIGYQQAKFSPDTWTLELRPIIDKQWGPWYVALNPALEESLKGQNSARGFEFAPDVKVSYDATKVVTVGVDVMAHSGRWMRLDTFGNQQHQIFPVIDLNFSRNWEFNFGVGIGLTHSTDHFIRQIDSLGRRF